LESDGPAAPSFSSTTCKFVSLENGSLQTKPGPDSATAELAAYRELAAAATSTLKQTARNAKQTTGKRSLDRGQPLQNDLNYVEEPTWRYNRMTQIP
jgi:hypothetical protein